MGWVEDVYTGGLIFGMLIGLHIWGAYIRGGGLINGGCINGILVYILKSKPNNVIYYLLFATLRNMVVKSEFIID